MTSEEKGRPAGFWARKSSKAGGRKSLFSQRKQWMPWHEAPKKDAHGSDIRRVGATILLSGGLRMGKPFPSQGGKLGSEVAVFGLHISYLEGTRGTETSQYPKEEKTIVIASVAVSEIAIVQTFVRCTKIFKKAFLLNSFNFH